MKWWGALSCLLVTQGLAQGPQPGPLRSGQCHVRCMQVYSGHSSEYDQVRPQVMGDLVLGVRYTLYVAVLRDPKHLTFVQTLC